jgi:hypothetical protein
MCGKFVFANLSAGTKIASEIYRPHNAETRITCEPLLAAGLFYLYVFKFKQYILNVQMLASRA